MFIIVGGDGVGKTTLENKLQEKTGYHIIKGSSFQLSSCTNQELFNHFLNIILGDRHVIVDRFTQCNFLYASKFDDYAILTEKQRKFIESYFDCTNVTVVYIHADKEIVKQRLKKRGDEYIKLNEIGDILDQYQQIFDHAKYKYIDIDTTNGITDEIINYLASLA